MQLISNNEITDIEEDWVLLGEQIVKCNDALIQEDYSQPIKPYLNFEDKKNRIIAMPARIGGAVDAAGIKWIASFPDNKKNGLPRVNSTTIINDTKSGQTKAIFNSEHLSSVRTVSVTYLLIKEYINNCKKELFNIGIIGFGPIGQLHYKMITNIFKKSIGRLSIYDKNPSVMNKLDAKKLSSGLDNLVANSDILITCTDTITPYITELPKKNSLVCNISLRDFCTFDEKVSPLVIVDNWNEVNRKGTNIESMAFSKRINESNVLNYAEVIKNFPMLGNHDFYFFNPMGLAIYDIAVSNYYLKTYFQGKESMIW